MYSPVHFIAAVLKHISLNPCQSCALERATLPTFRASILAFFQLSQSIVREYGLRMCCDLVFLSRAVEFFPFFGDRFVQYGGIIFDTSHISLQILQKQKAGSKMDPGIGAFILKTLYSRPERGFNLDPPSVLTVTLLSQRAEGDLRAGLLFYV